jgi:acetyl-CoA acetyltransferase
MRDVVVLGAGIHPYGRFPDEHYTAMAVEACQKAFVDAGVAWKEVGALYCGSVSLLPGCGHAVAFTLGPNGAPVTNVENASASGSSAFREAFLSIALGEHDLVVALGVDKLKANKGSRQMIDQGADPNEQFTPAHLFAKMARDHMERYGTTIDQLARVSVKSHFNASLNPNAHFRQPVTLEEVHTARVVADPLTVLHCCPWDEGAAAVILAAADRASRFTSKSCPRVLASVAKGLPGPEALLNMTSALTDLTRSTADEAYKRAAIVPKDLGIVELHDAFTIEEILYCESLGLCAPGEGGPFVESGATEIGGKTPVNTDGGLLSMGHPLGPTGLGQIAEILLQMRGEAGQRQIAVPPQYGLVHMVAAGGVCVIHILGR